ncbi:Multiple epidermal growth factor-like domains protein 6, partial [Pterocles gutturalis]
CDPVSGTCDCVPGFIGADCSKTCPENRYGKDCALFCACGKGQCDPQTGKCTCPPGQMGPGCQ